MTESTTEVNTGLHTHLARHHKLSPVVLQRKSVAELAQIHSQLEQLGTLQSFTLQKTSAMQHVLKTPGVARTLPRVNGVADSIAVRHLSRRRLLLVRSRRIARLLVDRLRNLSMLGW